MAEKSFDWKSLLRFFLRASAFLRLFLRSSGNEPALLLSCQWRNDRVLRAPSFSSGAGERKTEELGKQKIKKIQNNNNYNNNNNNDNNNNNNNNNDNNNNNNNNNLK